VIWARENGTSRVVYDALGHDAATYDSVEHRAILTRAADWLLREPA
jgi:type 1 glutamine amidotransferase